LSICVLAKTIVSNRGAFLQHQWHCQNPKPMLHRFGGAPHPSDRSLDSCYVDNMPRMPDNQYHSPVVTIYSHTTIHLLSQFLQNEMLHVCVAVQALSSRFPPFRGMLLVKSSNPSSKIYVIAHIDH
jgi:hypothetical protein